MRFSWLPLLICLTLGAGACASAPGTGDGNRASSSLTVAAEEGIVRLVRGSETLRIRSRQALSPGDRIEVGAGELATLTHRPDMTLTLWGGKLDVLSGSRFRLLAGKLLVETSSPLQIDAGDLRVSATRGLFRIDKQLATRVANYRRSSIAVALPPESLRVPAYRQVVTVRGVLPKVVQPLRFSASDRWDRRILSEAIDLDARVSNFAQGLEAQLAGIEGLEFFAKVLPPGSAIDFLRPHLENRRSDLLIGLTLSAEAGKILGESLDVSFERIFRLWTLGASWGLLAQEFGVEPEPLFARLTQAVERAQIQVIGPGPGLLRPPAESREVLTRRPRPALSPRLGAPAASRQSAPPAPAPGVLPAPVKGALPGELNKIVDDLLGAVDPVADLPPLL